MQENSRNRRDRAEGALFGLAVGDALGTTLEFTAAPHAPFAPLLEGPLRDIRGGGPFDVAPGQVTDDTQMAVCIAESLRAHRRYDAADVAARYVSWSAVAFDIGNQTADALSRIARGDGPSRAGVETWNASGQRAAGNGSLMRTAPLGVWFAADANERRLATLADSLITHADPRCVLACAAFNAAVAAAITNGASALAMLAAAREDARATAPLLVEILGTDAVSAALADVSNDLEVAEREAPGVSGDDLDMHRSQGFVRVALRLAFFELLHAPSFEAALVDVVNRGGDADTNGAITGALLGARHGVAAIPQRWLAAVTSALDDAPPGPFRDAYHPRAFAALLDALPG
jgi:ADP-ribosylglycohydrolase